MKHPCFWHFIEYNKSQGNVYKYFSSRPLIENNFYPPIETIPQTYQCLISPILIPQAESQPGAGSFLVSKIHAQKTRP